MNTIIKLIRKLLRRRPVIQKSVDPQYTIQQTEHHVSKIDISANAIKVVERLTSAGYEAYVVGGSVRDLLLRHSPKDFDVATNATPTQIRKLFRNARIIGRRFKLAHILFNREIIEVATFRGQETTDANQQLNERGMLVRDNSFGTLLEDAWRRDFSINSLYYDVRDGSIIDYTGGVKDIQQQIVRMIGDPLVRYQEDPVRMLRAIRFAAKLNFNLDEQTATAMHSSCHLINHISSSRLFEEVSKLYQCGAAEMAHRLLIDFGLFALLFPQTAQVTSQGNYPVNALVVLALESTDTRIRATKTVNPAFIFAVLLWFPLLACRQRLLKEGLDPLPALEKAMAEVIVQQNKIITVPKRYTQVMREIWLLQYRFQKRQGNRAYTLLEHPRFRAAYDFLALRALAGDESVALANWWTTFQEASPDEQAHLISALQPTDPPKKRKKPRAKPNSAS